MKKLIYVCSPYKGDVKRNIEGARLFSNFVFKRGNLPICVHLFLNEITNMSEEKGNREEIIKIGIKYLEKCDEIWILIQNGESEGMKIEIEESEKLGIKRKYFITDENGGFKELN